MKKEKLQERLAELHKQVADVQATLIALNGARNEVIFLLKLCQEGKENE